jgi:hypothetical protein
MGVFDNLRTAPSTRFAWLAIRPAMKGCHELLVASGIEGHTGLRSTPAQMLLHELLELMGELSEIGVELSVERFSGVFIDRHSSCHAGKYGWDERGLDGVREWARAAEHAPMQLMRHPGVGAAVDELLGELVGRSEGWPEAEHQR